MSTGRRPLTRGSSTVPRIPFVTRTRVVVRRWLARRRWLPRALVVAAAVAVAATTLDRLDRVTAARDRWGDTVEVLVATADTAAGDVVSVEVRSYPLAVVPRDAVAADRAGAPLVARQRVTAGEVMVGADVAAAAPLGLVPDGWLAVAVVETPGSGAEVGERVQVASDGVVIATDGLVVGHTGDATLIAVPADVAALLPVASNAGALAVLRSP